MNKIKTMNKIDGEKRTHGNSLFSAIRKEWLLVLLLFLFACQNDNSDDNDSQRENAHACTVGGGDFELIWNDEFESGAVDRNKWSLTDNDGCPGLCGFGNNELQYYSPNNASINSAEGALVIEARRQQRTGPTGIRRDYTSAKLVTKEKGDWKYGKFEIRAKLPEGQGIWPAIWMLPTDYRYGGWPWSGEIDIMEYLGHETRKVYATIHYGGPAPTRAPDRGRPGEANDGIYILGEELPSFSQSYHTFSLIWTASQLEWCLDGQSYFTVRNQADGQGPWYTNAAGAPSTAPFDQEFHLILNLAVGGNWPGSPNASTTFPQHFYVDYIRVYRAR